ncbi:hypothetical protein AHAS_Ahas14G0071300 [Arachis hypogaea]
MFVQKGCTVVFFNFRNLHHSSWVQELFSIVHNILSSTLLILLFLLISHIISTHVFCEHITPAKYRLSSNFIRFTNFHHLRSPSAPNAPWFTKATIQRFCFLSSFLAILSKVVYLLKYEFQISKWSL